MSAIKLMVLRPFTVDGIYIEPAQYDGEKYSGPYVSEAAARAGTIYSLRVPGFPFPINVTEWVSKNFIEVLDRRPE